MIDVEKYANYRCGFVAIIGKPNVGKSTLMNALLGEKISIISPKPQTTRQSIKGFLSDDSRQIVFLDTPGYLKPRYELHQKMLNYIKESLSSADLIVYITDVRTYPTDYDLEVCEMLKKIRLPKLAVLNKIDTVDKIVVTDKIQKLEGTNFDGVLPISALKNKNLDNLLFAIEKYLPLSPPMYDPEELSDLPMRFFAQEIIREQIFLNYADEIPYSTAVVVEKYTDYDNKAEIRANIWIERKSQKPIILGAGGQMIKKIRINSEKEIHRMIQKRVKLDLWIKIKPGWRKKSGALHEFGYR